MRQGVNAYGFKIKATHLMIRTESKRREKRRIKAVSYTHLDTPTQTKYQRLETLRAIFRTPGQSVPKPLSIVSEDTAAHGVDKVLFLSLIHI